MKILKLTQISFTTGIIGFVLQLLTFGDRRLNSESVQIHSIEGQTIEGILDSYISHSDTKPQEIISNTGLDSKIKLNPGTKSKGKKDETLSVRGADMNHQTSPSPYLQEGAFESQIINRVDTAPTGSNNTYVYSLIKFS